MPGRPDKNMSNQGPPGQQENGPVTDEEWVEYLTQALQDVRDNPTALSAPAPPDPGHSEVNHFSVSPGNQTFHAPFPPTTNGQMPAAYTQVQTSYAQINNSVGALNEQGYWNQQQYPLLDLQFDPSIVMPNSSSAQDYGEGQGPTPPGDFNQQQNGSPPTFNDPFPQNEQQINQQAAIQNQQTQQGARYSFNSGYQDGEQGYFRPQQSQRTSSDSSVPGTPGPNRVPIPRNGTSLSGTTSGPMSSNIVVPPRPKPGRKPIQNEENAADRRRMQNRNAQRNFRDRRQQKVSDMAAEMDELRKESQLRQAEFHAETARLNRQVRELQAENAHLRNEYSAVREQLAKSEAGAMRRDTTAEVGMGTNPTLSEGPQTGNKRPRTSDRSGPSPSSPAGASKTDITQPSPTYSLTEIDFTSRPAPRPMGQFRPTTTPFPPVTESPAQIMGIEGKSYDCGFCTDVSNCQCRYHDTMTANALVDLSRKETNDGAEVEKGDEEL